MLHADVYILLCPGPFPQPPSSCDLRKKGEVEVGRKGEGEMERSSLRCSYEQVTRNVTKSS